MPKGVNGLFDYCLIQRLSRYLRRAPNAPFSFFVCTLWSVGSSSRTVWFVISAFRAGLSNITNVE